MSTRTNSSASLQQPSLSLSKTRMPWTCLLAHEPLLFAFSSPLRPFNLSSSRPCPPFSPHFLHPLKSPLTTTPSPFPSLQRTLHLDLPLAKNCWTLLSLPHTPPPPPPLALPVPPLGLLAHATTHVGPHSSTWPSCDPLTSPPVHDLVALPALALGSAV